MTPEELVAAFSEASPDEAGQLLARHSAFIKAHALAICELQIEHIAADPLPSPTLLLTLPFVVTAAVVGNDLQGDHALVRQAVDVLTAQTNPELRQMIMAGTLVLALPDDENDDPAPPTVRSIMAEQAVAVARTLADASRQARPELVAALYAHGRALAELDQHDAALPVLREAAALGRLLAAEDPEYRYMVGDTLVELAMTLDALGRQTEMVRAFEEAETFGKPNPFVIFNKPPQWHLLFRIYLAREEESYLDRAITAAQASDGDIVELLEAYRHHDAVTVASRAAGLMETLAQEGRLEEYHSLHLMAVTLPVEQLRHLEEYNETEYERMLDLLINTCNRAISASRALGDIPCLGKYLFYRGSVLAHRQQMLLQETAGTAEEDLAEAYRLYTELTEWDPAYQPVLIPIAENLALLRYDPDRADVEPLLDQAVALCREVAAEDAAYWYTLSHLLTNLAYFHGERHAFEDAATLLTEAHDLYLEHGRGDPLFAGSVLITLINLGAVLFVLHRDKEALNRTREAVEIYHRLVADQGAGRPLVGTNLLCLYGYLLFRAGDLMEAREALREAINLTERYLVALPDAASQVRLLGRALNPYEHMVETCLRLAGESVDDNMRHQFEEEAWSYAERSRARLTAEFIHRAALASTGRHQDDGRSDLLMELADQRRELLTISNLIGWNVAQAGATTLDGLPATTREYLTARALRAEVSETFTGRIHELQARLEQVDPGLAALEHVAVPDLRAIQRTLRDVPAGALMLDLYPLSLSNRVAVFILDEQELRAEAIDCDWNQLVAYTEGFRAFLERPTGVRDVGFAQALTEALAWLGDTLQTVLGQITSDHATEGHHVPHLVLVPAGPLHHWPLWALPVSPQGERLVDHWACSVLPSADSLVSLATYASHPAPPVPLSVFAPPTHPPLPFSEATARFGAAVFGGVTYAGTEATFSRLRHVEGGVVVLSTHANVMLDAPELSWIQLARADGREDRVSAFEFLIGLDRLRSPLVTLLACEIHAAQPEAIDNWVGLSRAFLRTGRSLIASLWSIDDAATLALTVPLWEGLRAGMTVPQALRYAIRTLRHVDSDQLQGWTEALAAALPEADQATFRAAWTDRIRAETDIPLAPFTDPAVWAPYVAIGWPGALP